jgi:hypothetical protein
MTAPNTIEFREADQTEMLRLDSEGFHYKGQVIEDAGEAYRLFREWLAKQNETTND